MLRLKSERFLIQNPEAKLELAKKIQKEKFERILSEYDRKIEALSGALEEKAVQSIEVAKQAKSDELTIKELKKNKSGFRK